jgi:hypothetical protein
MVYNTLVCLRIYVDFNNDRFARTSGENAAEKYKKQMQERQLKLKGKVAVAAPTNTRSKDKEESEKDDDDEDDEYYDSMEYGDEFNDEEEQSYKKEKKSASK